MRHKLALTIALACFGIATALGVGFAGAEQLSSAQPTQTSGLSTVPSVAEAPACSNGLDDDGDGAADAEDPDCASPADPSEEAAPATSEAGEAPAPPASGEAGFQHGAAIGDGESVHRNEGIGEASGGGGQSGGVTAPPATAGVQLPEAGSTGGVQYGTGGAPTETNPTVTVAPFGPAPIGVPNFVIDSFEIPPFLLPIYESCGTEYGIPWEVLASINKIETGFGTNMGPSTAGAIGWMQFLPSSWEAYGLDANGDGRKDPYNPVDAICAAAHLLKISGGSGDLYKAIYTYNHADWYVQEVLATARAYGKLPPDLVGSLTGLTQGAHFPVAADASYADDLSAREALKHSGEDGAASEEVISSSPTQRGINIFSHQGAPVVAVNDGVIKAMGSSPKLGKYIVLEDAYRNRYIYAELGEIVRDGGGVLSAGTEPQPVVDSENLRPRLYALPGRAQEEQPQGSESEVRPGLDRNPQGRLEGRGGRRDRPASAPPPTASTRTSTSRSCPAGAGAAADRPEADPRRLEAARSDGHLPRRWQERPCVRPQRRRRPASAQGSAGAAGPARRRSLDLRMRPRRHRPGQDRPPGPGDARVPGLERLRTDDHLAGVRPRHADHVGQRLRAQHRRRGRHRRRSTACRSPATRARARWPTR